MPKNISKTREQKLAKAINQMDGWMQGKTRLILSISTPLIQIFLRGRVVGRQKRLFLFDNYGETCRIPVIPERYDRVLCQQKDPASVTFETSGTQGTLEMREDDTGPKFEEMCVNWVLANMAADAVTTDATEQTTR